MRTILLASLLFAAACGSDSGTAPSISALTYAPMTITAGQQATVTGSMAFDDKDGDLAEMGADVILPDQSKQSIPMTDIRALGDQKTGTINFALTIVPPTAGVYKFSMFVVDDGDNTSNKLDGQLTAQ